MKKNIAYCLAFVAALSLIFSLGAGYQQPSPGQQDALLASQTAQIIVVDGANTYVATAAGPGADAAVAEWQCKKINVSGGTTIITWANGDNKFDNIPGAAGAGLAALTYQ